MKSITWISNSNIILFYLFFKKILFIYLTERAQAGGVAEGEGEAGSLLSKDPDVGPDPWNLGS